MALDLPQSRPLLKFAAIVAAAAALILLLAPALWNGYPLLQYDTGGYLARWYEGYLVPSRSTVFGLYLHLGEGTHFWPIVIAQSVLTVWIVWLVLRLYRIADGPYQRLAVLAVLALGTSLPILTSILLTDIFAGLSVLALHLLVFKARDLARWQKCALLLLIAFAAAGHSATFAVLLALTVGGLLAALFFPPIVPVRGLIHGGIAIALGALMLLTTNAALSGRFVWTPGGFSIAFGRMLQDGIVARYLTDHCPDPRLRLCPYRDQLPPTADEFLWGRSVFNQLGRFDGLKDEMRTIALESLVAYPWQQITTATQATLDQLRMVATGAGTHNMVLHTYGIIERFIPGEVLAMRAARQQKGEIDFTAVNRLHVPAAWLSMILAAAVLLRFRQDRSDPLALLATTTTIALLTNAFVCGALSGPHDRYGSRMAWIATLLAVMAALRIAADLRTTARHRTVIAAP
jgi:hypothetical protein